MTPNSGLTVAQFVVKYLHMEGIRHVFGVPGGQPLPILDAIYEYGNIDFIATRHENAAAHAADAVGRLTKIPGVCLSTTGPGATNLLTGVGGALRDSSPMIVITVNNNRKDILRDDAQDADHVEIFKTLTKWSVQINHPDHAPEILAEAFLRATTGRPGPVHLDFTRDVLKEVISTEKLVVRRAVGSRILADESQLRQSLELISNARRPVMWVGNGVKVSGAMEEILELSELLHIPVITTFNGIGAVPTDHRNVFGAKSRMGGIIGEEILAQADLLIAVGNSLNGPSTSRWTITMPKDIIQIDIEQSRIGKHYPETIGVWGDAKTCLRYLANHAVVSTQAQESRGNWLKSLESRRDEWRSTKVEVPGYDVAVPVKPQALMKLLGSVLPNDTIYAVDAGNPGIWSHILRLTKTNRYMKPVNFGNMAFSLPAAIAAKLTYPENPVVCLVGDGSLGMSLAEIETAVREKATVIIVVMNDCAYGNIKQEQLHYFGPRYVGVDFVDGKYADIAKAFGADGQRVNSINGLQAALKVALHSEVPYLIDVQIDPSESVWVKPF